MLVWQDKKDCNIRGIQQALHGENSTNSATNAANIESTAYSEEHHQHNKLLTFN